MFKKKNKQEARKSEAKAGQRLEQSAGMETIETTSTALSITFQFQ